MFLALNSGFDGYNKLGSNGYYYHQKEHGLLSHRILNRSDEHKLILVSDIFSYQWQDNHMIKIRMFVKS